MLPTIIYNRRIASGLSQVEVCEAAGISQGLLSKIENGEVPGVSFVIVKAIAKVLQFELSDIA